VAEAAPQVPVVNEISGVPLIVQESAARFARTLRTATSVFIGFMSAVAGTADCNFTHCAAHGDTTEKVVNTQSKTLLDELEARYPAVFREPKYPIIENRIPFRIPLVDST